MDSAIIMNGDARLPPLNSDEPMMTSSSSSSSSSSASSSSSSPSSSPTSTASNSVKRPTTLFYISEQDENANVSLTDNDFSTPVITKFPSPCDERVTLPPRYQGNQKWRESSGGDADDRTEKCAGKDPTQTVSWPDRKNDIDVALKWIRQEILSLKQQDRVLMRQLLGLRATIHQLRMRGLQPSYSCSASMMSLGVDGPTGNGNAWQDGVLSVPVTDSPMNERDVMLSFQNRTMSMVCVKEYPDVSNLELARFTQSEEFFL